MKKLISYGLTWALTLAFVAGLCVSTSGCPKSDTTKTSAPAATPTASTK